MSKLKPINKSWVKPNTYFTDSSGNVYRKTESGYVKMYKEKADNGYYQVKLVGKDGKRHNLDIHIALKNSGRLGKSNAKNGEQVIDHKDGNKSNNNPENLQPTNQSHNIKNAHDMGLISKPGSKKKGIKEAILDSFVELEALKEEDFDRYEDPQFHIDFVQEAHTGNSLLSNGKASVNAYVMYLDKLSGGEKDKNKE